MTPNLIDLRGNPGVQASYQAMGIPNDMVTKRLPEQIKVTLPPFASPHLRGTLNTRGFLKKIQQRFCIFLTLLPNRRVILQAASHSDG